MFSQQLHRLTLAMQYSLNIKLFLFCCFAALLLIEAKSLEQADLSFHFLAYAQDAATLTNDEDFVPEAHLPQQTSNTKPKTASQLIQELNLYSDIALDKRPNIVFILTDDQPPNTLGIAGNQIIQTPNIDRLGKQGAYFTNMYLSIGQCAPSRASLWTGKMPHTTGVSYNNIILPPEQITLPEILRANQYTTGFVGKCHLGAPDDIPGYIRGFKSTVRMYPDWGVWWDWHNYRILRIGVDESNRANVKLEKVEWQYLTNYLTKEAISFINQNEQPFFLWLAYPAPHYPTIPLSICDPLCKDPGAGPDNPVCDADPAKWGKEPRRYPICKSAERYKQLSQIPLPISIDDNLSSKPPHQKLRGPSPHNAFLGLGDSVSERQDKLRNKIKENYEVISNIDENVGKIIETLQQKEVYENTVIIFLSDNGLFYGEHQLYKKGPMLYDELVKTPFIFHYPKLNSGQTLNNLTSSIDIMPTILDLLKIPKPNDVEGKSFLPLILRANGYRRPSVFIEYTRQQKNDEQGLDVFTPIRGIVNDAGFKFVHYLPAVNKGIAYNGSPYQQTFDSFWYELYNLNSDPNELNNLLTKENPSNNPLEEKLNDPQYEQIIRRLLREMAMWQTETNDPERIILSNLSLSNNTNSQIQLAWNTNKPATSEVIYRENKCLQCAWKSIRNNELTKNHSMSISNINQQTNYEIKIYAFKKDGSGGYSAIQTGTVTLTDIFFFRQHPSDQDENGKINVLDYLSLLREWLR